MICNSTIGELSRMTQFKDKSSKFEMANGTSTIPAGLLTYPPLMAADIILYDAKYVPVGVDQTQHVELTRDLVIKFNKKFGKTFVEPEALVDKTAGAKILDLQNPTKKMSKSAESKNGVIFLNDTPEKGAEKINKALTDNLNKVKYDPINQPGISNLITIYKCLANVSTKEIETKYKDIPNYGSFKKDLGLLVKNFLTDFQEKFNGYIKNPETILKITDAAAKKCRKITDAKVVDVYQKIGLLPVKK
jgi:tryptophanyl-tRNA synthetase